MKTIKISSMLLTGASHNTYTIAQHGGIQVSLCCPGRVPLLQHHLLAFKEELGDSFAPVLGSEPPSEIIVDCVLWGVSNPEVHKRLKF